jgi:hypothetical integral membrane protein (TIGR02206 family)
LTAEHLGALIAVLAVTVGLTVAARLSPGPWITVVSRVLGVAIALAEPSYWIGQALHGAFSLRDDLPLHLSRVAEFVAAAALWWPRPFLVELTYFWGLGAIVQALFTPDIQQHFPDLAYFRFYVGHGGVLVAAVFLTVGRRVYPRPGAPLRVFAATIAVTVAAALADLATGGNYMFLRAKPINGSLLNFMGPWPWYVATGLVLTLVLLALLNAPFWWLRRGYRDSSRSE